MMVNLCNWLYESGIHVEVVLIVGNGSELLDQLNPNIKVHVLKRKNRFDLKTIYRIIDLFQSSDLLHIHMRHNYRYIKLISLLSGNKQKKLILHDHSSSDKKLLGITSFLKPDFYIGTSSFSMQFAKNHLKIKNQCYLLENAIEKQPVAKSKTIQRFILASNIKAAKNQIFALNLMPFFEDYGLDLYGTIQDVNYYQKIQNEIKKLNIFEKTCINTECQNIQPVLSAFRLGLHTSPLETGPLVIIEYLAQGLPFLAYQTGDAAEKLSKEFPLFFIDNFNPDEWINRMRQILSAPPDIEKMSYYFDQYFSKNLYLKKCLTIYEKIHRS